MKIYTHKSNGFCNGVQRAVDTALSVKGERVFTYGEIVHNSHVVDMLKERGVYPIENLDLLKKGDKLIIRAHGAPPEVYEKCKEKGVEIIDATCKYVRAIQEKAAEYFARGYKVIIVGDACHPEVKGINGWCLDRAYITDGEHEIKFGDVEKALILFQTTFSASKIDKSLKNIKFNSVKTLEVFQSICYTTIDRQKFVDWANSFCDCIIVVGDKKSSNTTKLYRLAVERGKKAYFVENVCDVDQIDLSLFKNISIIAGASTPRELTEEVLSKMLENAKDDAIEEVVEKNEEIVKAAEAEETQEVKPETESAAEVATEEVVSEEEKAQAEVKPEGNEFTQAVEKMPLKYKPLRNGQKIKGTVSHIGEEGVSVSFGSKRDGFIPNEELALDGDFESAKNSLHLGDAIEAIVLSTDKMVTLSKKQLDEIYKDDARIDGIINGEEFDLEVIRAVKGGLFTKLGSYSVFIPSSHIRNGYVRNLEQYVGKKLRLIALTVDTAKKKIVASQKELINREKKAREDNFWNNIEVGEIVEGKVMRFAEFGTFVNVRGFDCLAHLSDLCWNPSVRNPAEILEIGKTYEFVVLRVDREAGRVSIGYKQLQPHPWKLAEEKYTVGSVHEGKVVRIVPYGAFIQLDRDIDGLLHISNVSWEWVGDINKVLKVGDIVNVQVLDFDLENRRITLSRKATMEQGVPDPSIVNEQAKEEKAPENTASEAALEEKAPEASEPEEPAAPQDTEEKAE